MVASNGGVSTYGDAAFYGPAGAVHLNAPIVGIAATPDGHGYWLAARDGGVFAYGNAAFHGSAGAIHLNAPVVGIVATFDGNGYWLVASDGGIFSYGDAAFYGSAGAIHLKSRIVGMARTFDGKGYWLVTSGGGVFTYGDAAFYGSAEAAKLAAPIAGVAATADGLGYWLVASDGDVVAYGDAVLYGSRPKLNANTVIVAITPTVDGAGYWLVASDGTISSYGDAVPYSQVGSLPSAAPAVGVTSQGLIIPSTTTHVDPSVVQSVSGAPGSGQTLVLSPGTAAPPVGQVLMLGITPQTPAGFMGKVTSVTTNPDGSIAVVTQPASLDDAFSAGTLSVTGTLDATDVASSSAGSRSQVLTPHDLSPDRTLQPIVVPMPHEKEGFECSGGATFTAGGSLSIVPSFNVTFTHDFLSYHPSASASASITTTETAEVDAGVAASADCTYTKTLKTIKFKEIVIAEGVVVQPVMTLTLSGKVGVEASVSAQILQTATATVGVSVTGSCDFSSLSCSASASPIDDFSADVTPTFTAEGKADATASLLGKLEFGFDDVVFPYIEVGPELDASATADASNADGPSASWEASACLKADVGISIEIRIHIKHIVDKTLFSGDYPIADLLGDSACKHWGGEGDGTDGRPLPPGAAE